MITRISEAVCRRLLSEAKIENYGLPNTIFSDMNEILMASAAMGGTGIEDVRRTVGPDAANQLEERIAQVREAVLAMGGDEAEADARIDVEVQNGQVSAEETLAWAEAHGFGRTPKQVFWTARPGALASAMKAAGVKSPATPGHPADIAIVFGKNKILGVSAKATKGTGDIGFKNPGWGTFASILNLKVTPAQLIEKELRKIDPTFAELTASARKEAIRSDPAAVEAAGEGGRRVLKTLRDTLLAALENLTEEELREFVVTQLVDAPENINPPYIKVTAKGGGRSAHVHDPLNNPMLEAINAEGLTAAPARNDSIVFSSSTNPGILQLRMKFESQALASSLKLTAEPAAKGTR